MTTLDEKKRAGDSQNPHSDDPSAAEKKKARTVASDKEPSCKTLESAKEFMLHVFQHSADHGSSFWQALAPEWKIDRDIAFAALTGSGGVGYGELPIELQDDHDLLLSAVQKRDNIWFS